MGTVQIPHLPVVDTMGAADIPHDAFCYYVSNAISQIRHRNSELEYLAVARVELLIRFFSAHFTPLASWIIIRIGSFLGRAQVFGHVTQVDADARPSR